MTIHNVEAEQQLLGSILNENRVFDRVSGVLTAESFYEPVHQRIFSECAKRIKDGHLVSPVTLKLTMEGDDGLKELGGPAYLARLAGSAMSAKAAPDYARVIIEASARREIQNMLQEGRDMLSEGRDSLEVRMALLGRLQSLPEASGEESSYSLLKSIVDSTEQALQTYKGEGKYLKTGIAPLDSIIRGIGAGNFCLIGGAPSMGKTSLAVEIACNVGMSPETGVVFVSLEMSKEEVANRVISRQSRIPYSDIRVAEDMSEADFRKWIEATKHVTQVEPIHLRIVPPHIRDIPAIYSAVRRSALDLPGGNPGLVVIDYAQLVRSDKKSRYEQMTDVSVQIKQLGRTLGCPVMPMVQLSRTIGERTDRRPHLYDIKESGQFENDADQAIFCHREAYWLERMGPKQDRNGKVTDETRAEWAGDMERWKSRMEIIVRKNRHGRIGTAEVGFHEPTNRFWRLGDEQEEFR